MTRNQEYKKELSRIKSAVRRAQKQGYTVPASIIPKTPRKVTAQTVTRAKSITPEYIRRMSVAPGQDSSLHEQLTRQLNRVKKVKAALESQHYIVPDLTELTGQIPTRLTPEYIKQLKKLTPEVIRYKSQWVDTETGELFSGGAGWRIMKGRKKGQTITEQPVNINETPYVDERDAAFESLLNTLMHLPNWRADKLRHLLEKYERDFGRKEMGAFLARAIRSGDMINYRLLASGSDGEVWENVSKFLSHLPDIGSHELEDIEEAFFDIEIDFL